MLRSLLLGYVLLAAAPAPLDARHTVLIGVLADYETMGCTRAQLRAVAADATIERVGRVDGDDVVLAHLRGGCPCRADCPVIALRLTSGGPRILLWSAGYWHAVHADTPLPRIVVRRHDVPPVSDEETYAYRGRRYVDVENARVRSDSGERKPDIAVRFAPGASSSQLHGIASRGWDDRYTFGAEKGQQLVVDGLSSRGTVALVLSGGRRLCDVSVGVPETLRATGPYILHVRPASERAVPYALRLAITSQTAPQQTVPGAGANGVLRCVPP